MWFFLQGYKEPHKGQINVPHRSRLWLFFFWLYIFHLCGNISVDASHKLMRLQPYVVRDVIVKKVDYNSNSRWSIYACFFFCFESCLHLLGRKHESKQPIPDYDFLSIASVVGWNLDPHELNNKWPEAASAQLWWYQSVQCFCCDNWLLPLSGNSSAFLTSPAATVYVTIDAVLPDFSDIVTRGMHWHFVPDCTQISW